MRMGPQAQWQVDFTKGYPFAVFEEQISAKVYFITLKWPLITE